MAKDGLDGIVTKINEAGKPVVDFKVDPGLKDPAQPTPTVTPLPADLARALGQTKP